MLRPRRAAMVAAALAALAGAVSVASADAGAAHSAAACRVLSTPATLGKTLLGLHRTYMRHQPSVHNPKITGPVGRVHLGICGSARYALADFNATYNGVFFGIQDGPERFKQPAGKGWTDLGNTGGDPCGAAPTQLLIGWKIVHSCPPG
jgi:hypothetical protein